MSSRIMYVRDAGWRQIGCVAISAEPGKQRAEYQLSMLNPSDAVDPNTGRKLKFDRKSARLIALERLVDHPITVRLPKDANQHSISLAVMQDIASSKTTPARARKFAKQWIRGVEFWFAIGE